ncbi:MAG: phage tail protein [Bacilli bacterium]|nr:phage tail protein [Bacilli bacterium]
MIEQFEDFNIEEASVQELDSNNETTGTGEEFGCVGTLSIEPELQQVVKNCGITQLKSVTKTAYLNVTIAGHINRSVANQLFGLTSDGLITGVKALDKNAVSKAMCFTAKVYNMDRSEFKYIALPIIQNISGFVKEIDNAATEVAYVELEFNALFDKNNKAYYEAIDTELTDEVAKSKWMKEFKPDLVKIGGESV